MKNKFDNTLNAALKKKKKVYEYKTFCTKWLILYPLMIVVYWANELGKVLYNRLAWSDKRTQRILSYAFLNGAEICPKEGEISRYFRSWGFYWKSYVKWYDKKYCKKYNNQITKYLFEKFVIEGYNKTVKVEDADWTLVIFKKI